MSLYQYRVHSLEVIDGDTVRAQIDLGLDCSIRLTCRLYGIDAPEMSTAAGKLAAQRLRELLSSAAEVQVHTYKDKREKYGRYLVRLVDTRGVDLNATLVREGFAIEYFGGVR